MTAYPLVNRLSHRVYAWSTVMPDELVAIHLTANPASETITPQDVIEQAIEVFAGMPLSTFAASAKPTSRDFSTATAKQRFLQHLHQLNRVIEQKTAVRDSFF